MLSIETLNLLLGTSTPGGCFDLSLLEVTPVEDSREMTQDYPIMPACIFCRHVIDNHANHFKDIDGDVFAPFIVGKSCPCNNLGRIF